jgi:hypothetical protein
MTVGSFTGGTTVTTELPCRFEPEDAAGKYLYALEGGIVPLELLFTGTLSWPAPDGRLQSAMVPWDREASFGMPLAVWRAANPDGEPGR